jgi:hypothetical protein
MVVPAGCFLFENQVQDGKVPDDFHNMKVITTETQPDIKSRNTIAVAA